MPQDDHGGQQPDPRQDAPIEPDAPVEPDDGYGPVPQHPAGPAEPGDDGYGPSPHDWWAIERLRPREPAVAPPAPDTTHPPRSASATEETRDRLRVRRRGPLRRFTLYASGVDTRILWYVPVEESEFVVQGSLVILTSVLAAVCATAAAGFLAIGQFSLTPVTVLAGLIWGVLVFFFDRALVSGTFNPHHFGPSELADLREPRSSSPWLHLVDPAEQGRPRGRRRLGEIVRVLMVASLRIVLALATSYIIAEMALFLVFQPEVNARTTYLQQQLQAQRIASIQADFAREAAGRVQQRRDLDGSADADILRLDQQVTDLTGRLDTARKDLGVLQAATAAELDGNSYAAVLSDGTTVTTTGRRGDGAAAQSLAHRRNTQEAVTDDLAIRLGAARDTAARRRTELQARNSAALSTLTDLDNRAAAQQQAAIAAAVSNPSVISGLLLRQAALTTLERDLHPETLVEDPIPPCRGTFAWACRLRNWVVPPTPMGPTVLAYRTIFFIIEILPITYKVISSLRRRRPYDVAKAALEESSGLDSLRLLDEHLHDAARAAAGRARQWRDWQAGPATRTITRPDQPATASANGHQPRSPHST